MVNITWLSNSNRHNSWRYGQVNTDSLVMWLRCAIMIHRMMFYSTVMGHYMV